MDFEICCTCSEHNDWVCYTQTHTHTHTRPHTFVRNTHSAYVRCTCNMHCVYGLLLHSFWLWRGKHFGVFFLSFLAWCSPFSFDVIWWTEHANPMWKLYVLSFCCSTHKKCSEISHKFINQACTKTKHTRHISYIWRHQKKTTRKFNNYDSQYTRVRSSSIS